MSCFALAPGAALLLGILSACSVAGSGVQAAPRESASPEVRQLLLKTSDAFRKAGELLLEKIQSKRQGCGHLDSYGYPVPSYGYAPSYGQRLSYGQSSHLSTPYYSPFYSYPVPLYQPPAAPVHSLVAPPQHYPDDDYDSILNLGRKFVGLAREFEDAADKRARCSHGNVAVNMREGSSSDKSDIVVEVTLGDVSASARGNRGGRSSCSRRKKLSQARKNMEEEEAEREYEDEGSASTSLEERADEDSDEAETVQVVEGINLSSETNPYQIETFDNTAAAVERTVEETINAEQKCAETKTIDEMGKETVLTVKTYEETEPRHDQAVEVTSTESEKLRQQAERDHQAQATYAEKPRSAPRYAAKHSRRNHVGSEKAESCGCSSAHPAEQDSMENEVSELSQYFDHHPSHDEEGYAGGAVVPEEYDAGGKPPQVPTVRIVLEQPPLTQLAHAAARSSPLAFYPRRAVLHHRSALPVSVPGEGEVLGAVPAVQQPVYVVDGNVAPQAPQLTPYLPSYEQTALPVPQIQESPYGGVPPAYLQNAPNYQEWMPPVAVGTFPTYVQSPPTVIGYPAAPGSPPEQHVRPFVPQAPPVAAACANPLRSPQEGSPTATPGQNASPYPPRQTPLAGDAYAQAVPAYSSPPASTPAQYGEQAVLGIPSAPGGSQLHEAYSDHVVHAEDLGGYSVASPAEGESEYHQGGLNQQYAGAVQSAGHDHRAGDGELYERAGSGGYELEGVQEVQPLYFDSFAHALGEHPQEADGELHGPKVPEYGSIAGVVDERPQEAYSHGSPHHLADVAEYDSVADVLGKHPQDAYGYAKPQTQSRTLTRPEAPRVQEYGVNTAVDASKYETAWGHGAALTSEYGHGAGSEDKYHEKVDSHRHEYRRDDEPQPEYNSVSDVIGDYPEEGYRHASAQGEEQPSGLVYSAENEKQYEKPGSHRHEHIGEHQMRPEYDSISNVIGEYPEEASRLREVQGRSAMRPHLLDVPEDREVYVNSKADRSREYSRGEETEAEVYQPPSTRRTPGSQHVTRTAKATPAQPKEDGAYLSEAGIFLPGRSASPSRRGAHKKTQSTRAREGYGDNQNSSPGRRREPRPASPPQGLSYAVAEPDVSSLLDQPEEQSASGSYPAAGYFLPSPGKRTKPSKPRRGSPAAKEFPYTGLEPTAQRYSSPVSSDIQDDDSDGWLSARIAPKERGFVVDHEYGSQTSAKKKSQRFRWRR